MLLDGTPFLHAQLVIYNAWLFTMLYIPSLYTVDRRESPGKNLKRTFMRIKTSYLKYLC